MKHFGFALLLLLTSACSHKAATNRGVAATPTNKCDLNAEQIERMMSLSYFDFIISLPGAPHELLLTGCHQTMIHLAEMYSGRHSHLLTDHQIKSLSKQNAYLSEVSGDSEQALQWLSKSYLSEKSPVATRWNYEVDAMIAFIKKSKPALLEIQKKMKSVAKKDDNERQIVDSLVRCFDSSLLFAYRLNCQPATSSKNPEP